MLPASNKGTGQNMGFPDPCLTPMGPVVAPVPYPNIGMHAMAAPFVPTILLTCVPALNMLSMIPMTMGDEAGVAHPFHMMTGGFTMGIPNILLQGLPAISLGCPTYGNNMNNPVGAVLVPSATNVFFACAAAGDLPRDRALSAAELGELGQSVAERAAARGAWEMLDDGVGYLAIPFLAGKAVAAAHHAIRELERRGMTSLVLDLRGNPGGELAAAIDLAGDFVEPGTALATLTDSDGDAVVHRAPLGHPHRFPLAILVDRGTASAAEVLAGCLGALGRAVVVGETTHGKGVAQAAIASPGGAFYGTVATVTLPGGRSIDGAGVEPHLAWPAAEMDAWRRAGVRRLPEALRAAMLPPASA